MKIEFGVRNSEFGMQNKIEEFKIRNPQSAIRNYKKADEEKLKKLTADFESVFLYYVLKTMRDTVPKSGFIDGKNGEEIYRSMMDQEIAKSMAEKRESGISDMLFKQLTQNGGGKGARGQGGG